MPICRRFLLAAGLLLALPVALIAQSPTTISGRVTSQDGTPLASANVVIPSLGVGAQSRSDGRYVLLIPASQIQGQTVTISARAVNYKPMTVQLVLSEGGLTQDFALAANPLQLGEIVVTGAGTVSEVEKIGNVRNNVDSTQIQKSNEANVVSALAAKAPNVEVISSAGDPGASSYIRIRGANTLGSTSQPLFIVDGTPIDNSTTSTEEFDKSYYLGGQGSTASENRAADINPQDIESIEILKGAAAGSIYGARAGQGVVLITTKHGTPGATHYSLSTSVSANRASHVPDLQQKFVQGDGGVADACATADPIADPSFRDCEATLFSWGPAAAPGQPMFDHARDVLTTGHTTDNTLTISGGNDRTTFYVSGSYLNQTGIFTGPNDSNKRYSFRLKGSQQVSSKLTIGGNVAYANTSARLLQKGSNYGGVYTMALRSPASFDNSYYIDSLTLLHRSAGFPWPSATSNDRSRLHDNPFFVANVPLNTALTNRVYGNVTADLALLPWLKLNYTLGVDYSSDERLEGAPQTSSNLENPLGEVIKVTLNNIQFDHNLIATASYRANPNIAGTVSVGQNLNTRSARQLASWGEGLIAPQPYNLSNTSTQKPFYDNETKVRDEGYFGQGTVDLYQQLYLKAGVRYDGSSTYGPANRRNWFPSVSGAWQFTKQTGDLGGKLSYGKARIAYGQTGTEPPPYLTNGTFVAGGSLLDPVGQVSLDGGQRGIGGSFSTLTRPASTLKPERTKELELGTDLGFFNDVADLSFTWYKRTSSDVILSVPVAASTGYQFEATNGAEIVNRGTEWMLNIRPVTKKNFAWDVGFQLGTNRSRVLSLRGANFVSYGGFGGFDLTFAQVGQPVGVFRDLDFVRCGRRVTLYNGSTPFDVDAACAAEGAPRGALFLSDGVLANASGHTADGPGYPILDPRPRVVGDPNPKWTGSVRTSVRVWKLTVSGLLDVRHGGVVYNGTRGFLNYYGNSKETERRGDLVEFGNDFLPGPTAGPGKGVPAQLTQNFFQNDYAAFSGAGQPFYENGGFVKLREISVGYTLSGDPVSRALGFSSIDLRVAGRNLHTWTKYTGIDPETSLAGAESGARGIDWFNNPQSRSYVFTVVINR